MKKLLLAIAFIGFIATSSFAANTALTTSFDTVQCDDKDCDKKDCKHDKKTCKKGDAKKACCAKKGDSKKACTAEKASAKKACCSKDKAKSCNKAKAAKDATKEK